MSTFPGGVVALLALALTPLGSAASSPSSADAGRSAAPQVTSSASGQCSKAEAIDAVKRLRLPDVSPTYPVFKVLCGAFTGAGSQTMVASIMGPDNVGMLYWAVFRWSGGDWRLLMKQRRAAILTVAGSDIRETVSIFRAGDSRCCPSGGTKTRIWHWNGSRLVADPWGQQGVGRTSAAFYSPSRNIACGMFDDSRYRHVNCQSRKPPQNVTLEATGLMKICRDTAANPSINKCNIGDPGEGVIPTLAYGRKVTVGHFRCASLQIGVRCTVIKSGRGFLISRDGVKRVGP